MPHGRGVSRKVNVRTGSGVPGVPDTRRLLAPVALLKARQELEERYRLNTAGLGPASRQSLAAMRNEEYIQEGPEFQQVDDERDWEFETLPDSTQESDSFMSAIQDVVSKPWRAYKNERTWRHRQARLQENWGHVIDGMTDAYIKWKYPPAGDQLPNPATSEYDFTLEVVDVFSLQTEAHIPRSADCPSPTLAVVASGFVPCSPSSPTFAISTRTLELYYCIRLRKPSFSVEAFAKVTCDLYNRPYRRRYRQQLSNALDAYLMIQRNVRGKVEEKLGRGSDDWRVLNACPACTYELEDEPDMRYRRMIAIDGNNSLSRMAPLGKREVCDTRKFTSDYFLDPQYVNVFAGIAKSHDTSSSDATSTDAMSTDAHLPPGCTDNMKAAADDAEKKSWGIFDETGIFAAACRHGMILWIADMVRSGELFKYPLAIVDRALDTLGPRILIGYDIGCKLAVTVANSPMADKFRESGSRLCVDAFHGYTHNYACQDKNHVTVIEGTGLEDLSTMERIFSASNQVAPVIRYATAYNRRLFIEMFFRQWDEDKYLNLGKMLCDNYKQARRILSEDVTTLEEAKHSLGITDDNIRSWHQDQSSYITTLGQEREWDVHAVAYVEILQKLWEACAQKEAVSLSFLNTVPQNYRFVPPSDAPLPGPDYATQLSQTRRLETARRQASDRVNILFAEAYAMELKMGIARRWEPADAEYMETVKYVQNRNYHRALDNLQRLVVLRLMELHKLNLGQAGYRMRTHIAKSLQARCKSIQNALKTYNAAAAALNPPAAVLEWSRVSHYSFLEEFPLLKETRQDIRASPWAQPAIREAMRLARRIDRAKEEIERCHVELRRVHTSIVDEGIFLRKVMQQLKIGGDELQGAVEVFVARRLRINNQVLGHIHSAFMMDDFTGNKVVGKRKGRVSAADSDASGPEVPPDSQNVDGDQDDEWHDDSDIDDDDVGETVGDVIDFISNL